MWMLTVFDYKELNTKKNMKLNVNSWIRLVFYVLIKLLPLKYLLDMKLVVGKYLRKGWDLNFCCILEFFPENFVTARKIGKFCVTYLVVIKLLMLILENLRDFYV